jgi:hypothetical protein
MTTPDTPVANVTAAPAFDAARLVLAVDAICAYRGISTNKAMREAGCALNTISIMRRSGELPGGQVLARLLAWTRLPAERLATGAPITRPGRAKIPA